MIFKRLGLLVSRYRPQEKLVQSFKSAAKKLYKPRNFLLSAAAMSSYDWEKEKFPDKELVKYIQDIDFCSKLKLRTLTCEACGLRRKIDVELPEISYCKCPGGIASSSKDLLSDKESGWSPYVERKDILVWRKEHAQKKGLYHYRLYGVFDDITVWEFLAVQLDLSQFRLGWDSSTAQCKEVDTQRRVEAQFLGPSTNNTPPQGVSNSSTLELSNGCESNGKDTSDAMVYYWEVQYPTFFSNRDYCCLRQHLTDPTGRMVISSKTTTHAKCPIFKKNWRVQDYQSVMAVRPTQHPDKPGVEFSLTAFEDPGVALPETIISWVAVRAMPEFMTNLRAACVKLRGAVGNAALPKPEHFRSSALQRDERLFEHGLTDEVLEESVSKGDAAYESAWIDKLLKDSDESCSESEENPVVARKSSVDLEASERIRKGEHVVPFLDPVDVGKPLDSFNSLKVIDETTDKTNFNNFANKCLDDIDERDAQNNKFQEDTLHMYDAEKYGSERRIKPLQDKPTVSSPVNFEDVLVPSMDKNTLNPTNVNDETLEPKPDVLSAVLSSPVNSPMRSELLEDDENQIDADQMNNNNRSEEQGKYSKFLLDSEQIASSSGYIEHEMELLLYEEKDISVQSTLLEHKFREVEAEGVQCEELLHLWFHLVTRKNVAFHRRLMLDILQSEQDLEKKCELLQTELRRGDIDEVGEKLLLEELLKVVDMRDQLVMARDREEISLQEEVELGKEVETKMTNAQDERKDKCKMQ